MSKDKKQPKKRIDIVSLKLVREATTLYKERKITSPEDAVELLQDFVGDCDREKFVILCLDTKNRPSNLSVISIGSLNASIVHPREVYKTALACNSASILLCHNHPSGDSNPSKEDISITKRLVEAGKVLGVNVTDHIILGDEEYYSMKENSLI